MKKSKFTDSQIMEALKRAESGLAVSEVCRDMDVSSATFYKWRAMVVGQPDQPIGDDLVLGIALGHISIAGLADGEYLTC